MTRTDAFFIVFFCTFATLGGGCAHRQPVSIRAKGADDPRLAELRGEQLQIQANLVTAREMLEALRRDVAAGREPFIVDQIVEQDVTVQRLRAAADNYQKQYEQMRDQPDGPAPAPVELAKQAADRARVSAADHERELRAKTRDRVFDQCKQQVAELQESADQLDRQLHELKQDLNPTASSTMGDGR